MATLRHSVRPGLREVWALWGLYALIVAAVFATYARLPVQDLYHVSTNGRTGGASRALVVLNFPTALAAIAIAGVVAAEARSRTISRLALVAVILCAAVAWPGVVDQVDLDAKWSNVIAAMGVLLAFGLTVAVTRRYGLGPPSRVPGDGLRVVAAVILVLLSVPWIVAELGFLITDRWPLLGSLFYSDEWHARLGHARLHRAVHEGHHHGIDGTLLALTAIFLSRTLGRVAPRLRPLLAAYLGLMLVYGLANLAQDFWLEQLVKRAVTSLEVPSLLVPSLSVSWLVLLVLAGLAYMLLSWRVAPGEIGHGRLLWPAPCLAGIAALLVVGFLQEQDRHVTPLGSVDGIAFAHAPEGRSHLFVTRGRQLVQLTDGDDAELAPDWSADGLLVFQSNRDDNWELYTMNADGSGLRRLTDDEAADGEPRWSPDAKRIAFVRDGDLYVMRASGDGARKVDENTHWPAWSPDGRLSSETSLGRYPAWSPRGDVLALECLIDDRWHICLRGQSGAQAVLTPGEANDFAPAWSPDGRRIAFISDRDGNDQLYVVRADGSGLIRLTGTQGDKDTPAWRR